MAEASWKCWLCWQLNVAEASRCVCCRRDKSCGPKSLVDAKHAKPFALHGLGAATHPFRMDQIVALADAGLDLQATDSNGWTALHCAARLGQDGVVHNLLEAVGPTRVHALVEAASIGGWRALHHAIAANHVRVVEELLVADADVGARLAESADGLTPLHLAAKLGHVRIVELLLQCGADAQATTHHLGRTALHLAIDGGPHVETIRFLCARTDLAGRYDTQGLTPLQQAVRLSILTPGRKEIVATIESALRERGVSEVPLLSVFLSENLEDDFTRR